MSNFNSLKNALLILLNIPLTLLVLPALYKGFASNVEQAGVIA